MHGHVTAETETKHKYFYLLRDEIGRNLCKINKIM